MALWIYGILMGPRGHTYRCVFATRLPITDPQDDFSSRSAIWGGWAVVGWVGGGRYNDIYMYFVYIYIIYIFIYVKRVSQVIRKIFVTIGVPTLPGDLRGF